MAQKIFVLGNQLVQGDKIALDVAAALRTRFPLIAFEEIESIGAIAELPKALVLMDAVKGAKKVQLFRNLEKICPNNVFSLHDLDSGFQLKLFKKMGKIKKAAIIGIPQEAESGAATEKVAELLEKNQKTLFKT